MVLTDSDAGTKTENRAESLRADFKDIPHIDIQVTTESTFEKDLISSNRSGDGKELLFDALSMTKSRNGPKLRTKSGASDIDIEAFFAEVENYKAEFAFSIMSALEDERQAAERDNRSAKKLTIPKYILMAFDFIRG